MYRYLPLVGFVASLIAFVWAAHLPLLAVGVVLLTLAAMSLPGIVFVRRALPEEPSPLIVLVFGAVLGLALSRFGLVAVSLLLGPGFVGPIILLLVLAIPSAIALAKVGLPAWSEGDRSECRWLLGMLAVLFVVLAVAFGAVGRLTPEGFVFAPYFDRDFMNHIAVTAEVARSMPPENPYLAGERFHYYWGFHLWPAAVKSLTGATARAALTATLAPTVALFVAALVLWSRRYLGERSVRIAAVALGLFAFSYIGPLLLLKLALPSVIQKLPGVSSRDFSFLSHSWFRDFLYEPHAVTALTLLLTVFVLNSSPEAQRRPLAGFLIGVAFGAMLITDAFVTLVGLLYFAASNLPAFVRDRATRLPVVISAVIFLGVLAAAVGLGVFPLGNRTVSIALHPMTKVAPAYLLVDLGPLFVLGVFGAILLAYRGEFRPYWPLLGLLALALVIGFTLRVSVEPNIALRKAVKVAQIPLIVFVGLAVAAALSSRHWVLWTVAGAVIVLPGFTTLFTDLLLYYDQVENRSPAPTYVSQDEMEMLDWVRDTTPPDAVLQMGYPDRIFRYGTPMLLEGLAERRTYYGNDEMPAMFQGSPSLIGHRKAQFHALVGATSGTDLARTLKDLPPLYLFVDEGGNGPKKAIAEAEASGVLTRVHRIGRFSLYKIPPPGDGEQ